MVETIILVLGLAVASVQDLRWRKIGLPFLWGMTVLLLVVNYYKNPGRIIYIVCPLFYILLFLAVHWITHGQIGVGDAFVFGMTGAGLGFQKNFTLILLTFFFAFITACFLLICKKKDKNYELPLVPCIFLAYIFMG